MYTAFFNTSTDIFGYTRNFLVQEYAEELYDFDEIYIKTNRRNDDFWGIPAEKPMEGAADGTINILKFRNQISKVLDTLESDAPLFSVIDHNSAHHVSWGLAKHAFSNYGDEDAKKLIINFDAHKDFSKIRSKHVKYKIRCNNWAAWAVAGGVDLSYRIAHGYMHIGHPANYTRRNFGAKSGDWGGSKYYAPHSSPVSFKKRTVESQVMAALKATGTSPVDAYVTLDRDVMIGSGTSYGCGEHLPKHLFQALDECLATLYGAGVSLCGFDICGLPAFSASFGSDLIDNDPIRVMERAKRDISTCIDLVTKYFPEE